MFFLRSFLAGLVGLTLAGLAAAPALADYTGAVRVIDGDTFEVAGVNLRLHGIDAPERGQDCLTADNRAFDCGEWVRDEVRARYEGRAATCVQVDWDDRYSRPVVRCIIDGADVGQVLVAEGLARAYRDYSWDYDLDEKAAQVLGLGLWNVVMQEPADYRRDQRTAPPPPDATCAIKGNISGNGHIYHMPHNNDYDRTRIDTSRGERWFCSEAEARDAGWRPARN